MAEVKAKYSNNVVASTRHITNNVSQPQRTMADVLYTEIMKCVELGEREREKCTPRVDRAYPRPYQYTRQCGVIPVAGNEPVNLHIKVRDDCLVLVEVAHVASPLTLVYIGQWTVFDLYKIPDLINLISVRQSGVEIVSKKCHDITTEPEKLYSCLKAYNSFFDLVAKLTNRIVCISSIGRIGYTGKTGQIRVVLFPVNEKYWGVIAYNGQMLYGEILPRTFRRITLYDDSRKYIEVPIHSYTILLAATNASIRNAVRDLSKQLNELIKVGRLTREEARDVVIKASTAIGVALKGDKCIEFRGL